MIQTPFCKDLCQLKLFSPLEVQNSVITLGFLLVYSGWEDLTFWAVRYPIHTVYMYQLYPPR